MLSLEDIFPPFALRITCGPVEMRVLRDDDLPELVELVGRGIEAPGLPMPFLQDWQAAIRTRFARRLPDHVAGVVVESEGDV
jgi:hypothetical protein